MRRALIAIAELIVFSALIIATRCANYGDVFVGGNIFFTDADCYSRMTRVRMCVEHPGLIVRHHAFENFPAGTTPHTTAPLDYLIAALSAALGPFTTRPVDLAGAIVSPLLGLLAGWFLWWWSWRRGLRLRFALLVLYAISPILVHATELGRPDHQSLVLTLIAVALCAECTLMTEPSRAWGVLSGAAWGLALWVSLYEPLILLAVLAVSQLVAARKTLTSRHRRTGWLIALGIVLVAVVVERRLPDWPRETQLFSNWARMVGELNSVPVSDPVWLRWTGLLLLALPAAIWIAAAKRRTLPIFLATMLGATFALTMWQARWGYFFVLSFCLALPSLLNLIPHRMVAGILMAVSLFPVLQEWDARLWPDEPARAALMESRRESLDFRELARQVDGPFVAPWWWSPALSYWSGQPGVAGSSHEALGGIEQSARFYLAANPEEAREILLKTGVKWVVAYEADRTVATSSALLGTSPSDSALGRLLDRAATQAPSYLQLSAQNSTAKLFRVGFFPEK